MMYRLSNILIFLFSTVLISSCSIQKPFKTFPDLTGIENIDTLRVQHNDSLFSIGKNTLLKNEYGIWELYLEGNALERGLKGGSLTRELMHIQEEAIMSKIQSLVPKEGYQKFLKKVVAFFNRKLYLHVTEEYKAEIYGVSRFALEKDDNFASSYLQSLYLHGAHDIGHALQDLMLVGCTSFAAWDSKTQDGQLMLGRNFDFYVNDEFAREKIVAFINPEKGHKFMMYTWGGMIGAVSGMNEKGLSVTINAGKSNIPLMAKTPISLVAREILQYAETTVEAIEIAKKREVFVSEAIMIGSAREQKALLIEVSPRNFGVYEVENADELICSNHFQSAEYTGDRRNLKTIEESHTQYRFDRMEELLSQNDKLTPDKAAAILRNTEGLEGSKLGYGNEKAINQLLAHHGILFKPDARKVWVSANPYQLGAFVAYDLVAAFQKFEQGNVAESVADIAESIPEADFVNSKEFRDYEKFRKLNEEIKYAISSEENISEKKLDQLILLNPYYWKAYSMAGQYYFQKRNFRKAVIYFKQALHREVPTSLDEQYLEKMIKKSYRKL